ncbi:hypothetical protein [Streptomyces caeruleatus]|uniref:hypothetical protein n=1 Tax=Streptomyces caeruleatus TaxID=661399 RepID=UPI000A7E11E2|nr:hypothetical protein [Streptomyces caeruleatus]
MALLAVLLPLLMLGAVLALGRYEDLLLPRETDETDRPEAAQAIPMPAPGPSGRPSA